MHKPLLIFFYTKQNRYSINSLLASLQTKPELISNLEIKLTFTEEEIYETIKAQPKTKKIILAISFVTKQLPQIEILIKKLKTINSKIFTICGGPHPTGSPHTALNLGFELAVIHEAEDVFNNLIEKLINEEELAKLSNLAFIKNGKLIKTQTKISEVNLDNFPAVPFYFNRFGPIEITRGCPYRCAFCQTSQIFGTKLRHRSVHKICEAVEIMVSKGLYDTRFITPSLFLYGSNDGKNLNLEKLDDLFKSVSKIIKPKGKLFIGSFPSELRPEHINKDTVELLKKYADNNNVIVGVQSGSERILELSNRQHTLKDVYKAVELLNKSNFLVNLDIIFGLPYETQTDIKKTIKFIENITTKFKVRIHAHIFTPIPGTKFQNFKQREINTYQNYFTQSKLKNKIYGNFVF